MDDAETSPKRRIPLWPFFFCVLPILVGIGLVVFINQPGPAADSDDAAANGGIPDLGSRGRTLPGTQDSVETPAEDEETNPGPAADEDPEAEPEDEPERVNTRDQIETWLINLALAAESNNREGIRIHHELLEDARPGELVDELVETALKNESNAWVRIQFYHAFHDEAAKRGWSLHVYNTRTAKFMGTDTEYAGGEMEELKLHATELLDWLIDSGSLDTRVMAMLINVIQRREPDWLLEIVLGPFLERVLMQDRRDIADALRSDLEALFANRELDWRVREAAFMFWTLHFEPRDDILTRVEQPGYSAYLPVLVGAFPPRGRAGDGNPAPLIAWLRAQDDEVRKIAGRVLSGPAPADEKRRLIRRIADHELPGARKLIEDGLARQDDNYADYLAAFGRVSSGAGDLQRLTAAADDADVEIARGAIEGLRRSPLPGADGELRKVLEQGSNPGVRSQALGALLDRAESTTALLEEYLDANRPSALRAVAVSHVDGIERLMRVVEEDASPVVRKAALDKLGALRPSSTRVRKELVAFFNKVKLRDNSMVIRSDARKYAAALKE